MLKETDTVEVSASIRTDSCTKAGGRMISSMGTVVKSSEDMARTTLESGKTAKSKVKEAIFTQDVTFIMANTKEVSIKVSTRDSEKCSMRKAI